MKPRIEKTILKNGRVDITIVTKDRGEVLCSFYLDDKYIDFGKQLSEREQLQVIQSAFQAGVETAIAEMSYLLRSISTERISPSTKISYVEKQDDTH